MMNSNLGGQKSQSFPPSIVKCTMTNTLSWWAIRDLYDFILKKLANPGLLSVYFRSFLVTISIQIEKSVDGVLGIRTWGRRTVGADETTELWRPSYNCILGQRQRACNDRRLEKSLWNRYKTRQMFAVQTIKWIARNSVRGSNPVILKLF